MSASIPSLAAVRDLAREHPQFGEASLRDWIYHSTPRLNARGETIPPNGFAPCMVRVGRRVLIDRDAFARWIERGRVAPLAKLDRRAAA